MGRLVAPRAHGRRIVPLATRPRPRHARAREWCQCGVSLTCVCACCLDALRRPSVVCAGGGAGSAAPVQTCAALPLQSGPGALVTATATAAGGRVSRGPARSRASLCWRLPVHRAAVPSAARAAPCHCAGWHWLGRGRAELIAPSATSFVRVSLPSAALTGASVACAAAGIDCSHVMPWTRSMPLPSVSVLVGQQDWSRAHEVLVVVCNILRYLPCIN